MSVSGTKRGPMMVKTLARAALMLMTLLTLCSASAQADWVLLPGDTRVYFDKDRIERHGKDVSVWELIDWEKPSQDLLPGTDILALYFSQAMLQRLDCEKHTISLLAWIEYAQPRGKGTIIKSYNVLSEQIQTQPIVSGSIGDQLAQSAC